LHEARHCQAYRIVVFVAWGADEGLQFPLHVTF
jgi:hypothetical protein